MADLALTALWLVPAAVLLFVAVAGLVSVFRSASYVPFGRDALTRALARCELGKPGSVGPYVLATPKKRLIGWTYRLVLPYGPHVYEPPFRRSYDALCWGGTSDRALRHAETLLDGMRKYAEADLGVTLPEFRLIATPAGHVVGRDGHSDDTRPVPPPKPPTVEDLPPVLRHLADRGEANGVRIERTPYRPGTPVTVREEDIASVWHGHRGVITDRLGVYVPLGNGRGEIVVSVLMYGNAEPTAWSLDYLTVDRTREEPVRG